MEMVIHMNNSGIRSGKHQMVSNIMYVEKEHLILVR